MSGWHHTRERLRGHPASGKPGSVNRAAARPAPSSCSGPLAGHTADGAVRADGIVTTAMKAYDRPILSLVSELGQFIIPQFQRPYRWNDEQCLTLLYDVADAAGSVSGERHFLGSIVYRQLDAVHGYTRSLLVDGQQRLTTLTLILCALRELSGDNLQRRGQLGDWLVNRNQDGLQRYKLILRGADQVALQHIVDHGSPQDSDTGTVAHRYRTLREALQNRDPDEILQGLDFTCHVDVVLKAHDNHQAIFESLNAKFEPLSLLDKVRNFALMGLNDDEMTRLWDGPWRGIEDRYGGQDDDRRKEAAFGLLVRDLLALAGTYERRRDEDAYARVKRMARRWETGTSDGRIRFVEAISKQAEHHAAFTLGVAVPDGLEEPLTKCRRLSDTPGPVVLRLLDALGNTLNVNDVRRALQTIESVLVRRRCCGRVTGAERDAFARLGRMLKPQCTADDIDLAFSRAFSGGRRVHRGSGASHDAAGRTTGPAYPGESGERQQGEGGDDDADHRARPPADSQPANRLAENAG